MSKMTENKKTKLIEKLQNKRAKKKESKRELKKLIHEGKYEDIYRKYGEKTYNELLPKVMYNEIKNTQSLFSAIRWKVKENAKRLAKKIGLTVIFAGTGVSAVFSHEAKQITDENAKIYEYEIEKYNEKIEDYASKIKKMGLTDIQTFMKVMDDMWKNIDGYGTPAKDIHGFYELDLVDENGYGVCRNMASDVAKKLNKINPEYNARKMTVYMSEGDIDLANIERNFLEKNETVLGTENEDENSTFDIDSVLKGVFGNHAVTLVDLKNEDITLVLDPTNPGIGVYSNGKITMFNAIDKKPIKYYAKEYTQAVFVEGGINGVINVVDSMINSFSVGLDYEQLEKKYGVDAQNKALKEVRALEIADYTLRLADNSFDEKYRVKDSDLEVQNLNYEVSYENIESKDNENTELEI